MAHDVFHFRDYRAYLAQALPVKGPQRGQRAKLAEWLGCKSGFISLVITERAHFSAEHALAASRFLQHGPDEDDFFLLLVAYARAGAKDLEDYYRKKIDAVLLHRKQIRERIRVREGVQDIDQLTYYSSWHYAGIHMSLYAPTLQTKAALAAHFRLSNARVSEILKFLIEADLVEQKGDRYLAKPSRIHLPAESPLISKHHANWRQKAIQALDDVERENMHYSLVMSASPAAIEKIREILLGAIQATEPVLQASADEKSYVLAMDLFALK